MKRKKSIKKNIKVGSRIVTKDGHNFEVLKLNKTNIECCTVDFEGKEEIFFKLNYSSDMIIYNEEARNF